MKMLTATSRTLALWTLALPMLVVVGIFKVLGFLFVGRRRYRYAWSNQMRCRHCRKLIALVRGWRCKCGFTYVGSVLQLCPVCGTRPRMVRCDNCGLTWTIR